MLGPCFPVPWLCRCKCKRTTRIDWIALWHFRDNKCEAYLYNLSRLWDAIAFLYRRLCRVHFQWSHRVNSAHANPWLLGLSDGTKACGLSRVPVAVPISGGGSGVTLTPTKTTLISNTCLCFLLPSSVSPHRNCALFPVVVATRR